MDIYYNYTVYRLQGVNMTKIYFVRHCSPNFDNKNDRERELTIRGLEDRKYISDFLMNKGIDVIFSSPYKRCIDTIKPFADAQGLPINLIENLRERAIGRWVEKFNEYAMMQWNDFDYKMEGGESLSEVQSRNIVEINTILEKNQGKNIVISTHGTAFSTIVNYYNDNYNYNSFFTIKSVMPFIACSSFDKGKMISCEIIDPCTTKIILSI